jgi:hypothetical protein
MVSVRIGRAMIFLEARFKLLRQNQHELRAGTRCNLYLEERSERVPIVFILHMWAQD